jgi:cysteine desulfurase
MVRLPVYLDNHATTRVDPRVVDAMLPLWLETFGNAGSTSHPFGWDAKAAVDAARASIAAAIGASPREIVFTSGATESNNLALKGAAERQRRRGNHIVSVSTEHRSVLDPLARLARRGFDVTLLPVLPHDRPQAGRVDVQQLVDALRPDTILVSVMLANNEIGVIQPLADIAAECRQRGIWLHTDATQAVGKIPVDVQQLQVDLMSFTAHKIYGPKGSGALYVRRRNPAVRLEPLLDGGGQEMGLRSGTLNVAGIVGLDRALQICIAEMAQESNRLAGLRRRLFDGLASAVPDVMLNGPSLELPHLRLPGNLNCSFAFVDGEALMMSMRDVAVSSGSACTSANPEPSHVLRALGLSDDQTRASLRFGIGRFNAEEEIDFAIQSVAEAVQRLRAMSSLAR